MNRGVILRERMKNKSQLSIEEARNLLRAAGLRSTSSRIAVLQCLDASTTPRSHAEVADELVPQGHDKSTLYRCLVELADCKILSRQELGDHSWRFELMRNGAEHATQHPHFVCVDCGKVECLNVTEVEIRVKFPKGVKSREITEVTLKGHCAHCK